MPGLALLAVAFGGGTVAAAALDGPWWATAMIAALLAGAAYVGGTVRSPLLLAAVVALAAAGHARLDAADRAPPPPLASVRGVHALEGVARTEASRSGTFAHLDLDIDRLDGASAGGGLRLTLPASRPLPRAGDRLRLTGRIEDPPAIEGFDYAGYLRARGIHAVVAFPSDWAVLEAGTGAPHTRAARALHRGAVANIARALPEPEAALAAGMLLGERGSLPPALTEALRVTGTSHLVVVSGQNVAMLLGAAIALLTPLMSRRRAAVLSLALLPSYVALVGAEPPVVRAALMAVGIAAASVLGRRTPAWIYLAYASALMLALDPRLVRDVSFQLSVSATAGVMLLAPPMRDWALSRFGAGPLAAALIEAATTALGATLAVMPVQVAVFEALPLLAVPANVLVTPLYGGTVAVAIAAAILGWFEPAAWLLAHAGRALPQAFIELVSRLGTLPGARVTLEAPPAVQAAWYLGVAALAWLLHRAEAPVLESARGRGVALTAALGVAAVGSWAGALAPHPDFASLTVLDVGQGLAVLVQAEGAAVLVDAGPPDGAVLTELAEAGAGGTLAAVVLTHADADHAGGLPLLRERMRLGHVLAADEVREAFSGDARFANIEHIDIGDRIRLSERVGLEVLSPPVVTLEGTLASVNDRSLVLLVRLGERRVLIAADIEDDAERWLAASGLDLRADALVVPHHGSKSSSTPELLAAVEPRLALISVGARNSYGHPGPEVLDRYEAARIRVLRTDINGTLTLRSDGSRLWAASER